MITFRHMLSLAPDTFRFMRYRAPVVRAVSVCVLVALASPRATAQSALTHTDDAAPVPRGMLRTRITTGWTRYDERFAATGRRLLDADFSSDSLGARELPGLAPIDVGLQTLTADPKVRLSLGRLAARSDVRIVTTPIAFEYGLTRRLSVGVVVPLVQTRRTVVLDVNADKKANAGFIPLRSRSEAAAANALAYNRLVSAADSLSTLLAKCPSTPTAAGCAAVNANAADARAARQEAARFADAIKLALGIDTSTVRVAPRKGSDVASKVEAQRAAIDARLRTYLGSGAGTTAPVFFAASDFSYIDLQGRDGLPGLLQSALGGGLDSLRTTDRLSFGDISVGAQLLVIDRFQFDTLPLRGLQMRLAVGGAFRFGTSLIDSTRSLVAIPTGDGAGVELRSALDMVAGKYIGGTVAARVVKSFARNVVAPLFGDPEAIFPVPTFGKVSRTAGTLVTLDVTPRLRFGDWFSIDGRYGLERTGATTFERPSASCATCQITLDGSSSTSTAARTAHRVGAGIRYSTVDSYLRGSTRLPIEVSFTHLETISGDAGVAKLTRDQIQLRLFLRLLGR